MISRELKRAQHIYQCLGQVGPDRLEKYSDRLKGAPAQIMENGLLQTLAFFNAKGGDHRSIAADLMGWLIQERLAVAPTLEALSNLSAVRYRHCSEEAVAWLNWAKRLALAKVKAKEG